MDSDHDGEQYHEISIITSQKFSQVKQVSWIKQIINRNFEIYDAYKTTKYLIKI